jgi:hypothetical protein
VAHQPIPFIWENISTESGGSQIGELGQARNDGTNTRWRISPLFQFCDRTRNVYYSSVTEPEWLGGKILLSEPSVYAYFGGDLGTIREAFVMGAALETGRKVFASTDEKRGDLIVDDRVIEVGGKTKPKKGADFVVRDDIDLPVGKAIPMWVWGFEY